MKFFKNLFAKKKANQIDKQEVINNLSFKEKMVQDFIPEVLKMAKKEEEHLKWLKDNDADADIIEESRKSLLYFKQRYKEYNDYVATLD